MNADKEFDDSTTTLAGALAVRALPDRWLQYFPGMTDIVTADLYLTGRMILMR